MTEDLLEAPMYYVLNEKHELVPTDLMTWVKQYENFEKRFVAQTMLPGQIRVSTVFLGMDHNFGGPGPPVCFETMAFDRTSRAPHDTWYRPLKDQPPRKLVRRGQRRHEELCQFRHETWDRAVAGHKRVVAMMRKFGKRMHEARMAGDRREFNWLYNTVWQEHHAERGDASVANLTLYQMVTLMGGKP